MVLRRNIEIIFKLIKVKTLFLLEQFIEELNLFSPSLDC
jgi:hypothetical protein